MATPKKQPHELKRRPNGSGDGMAPTSVRLPEELLDRVKAKAGRGRFATAVEEGLLLWLAERERHEQALAEHDQAAA